MTTLIQCVGCGFHIPSDLKVPMEWISFMEKLAVPEGLSGQNRMEMEIFYCPYCVKRLQESGKSLTVGTITNYCIKTQMHIFSDIEPQIQADIQQTIRDLGYMRQLYTKPEENEE